MSTEEEQCKEVEAVEYEGGNYKDSVGVKED